MQAKVQTSLASEFYMHTHALLHRPLKYVTEWEGGARGRQVSWQCFTSMEAFWSSKPPGVPPPHPNASGTEPTGSAPAKGPYRLATTRGLKEAWGREVKWRDDGRSGTKWDEETFGTGLLHVLLNSNEERLGGGWGVGAVHTVPACCECLLHCWTGQTQYSRSYRES